MTPLTTPPLVVVMVGSHGVGKSSVARRLADNSFESNPVEVTIGPEFFRKTVVVRQRAIKAQIWDTAGQEKFGAITRGYVPLPPRWPFSCRPSLSYFRNALGAVLVYEISDKESYNALDHWLTKVRDWAPDATICLVGNKSDLNSRRKVTTEEGQRYAKANEIGLFFETSALNGNNIKQTFCDLMAGERPKVT